MKSKTITSIALAGAAALLLAACSSSAPVSKDAPGPSSSSSGASAPAKPKTDAAPAALPFNAGGLFAGNAKPTFPTGEPGKVAVAAEGPLIKNSGGGELLFAYRNNTSKAIAHVDFTGSATAGGKIVATGRSQDTVPAQVKPGEVGLGLIFFEDPSSIPDTGVTYAFQVTTMPADTSSYNTAPLKVSQATNNGTSIVGAATNETGEKLAGPFEVETFCFNGNSIAAHVDGFADQSGDLAAGGQATFTVDLLGTQCDDFALSVDGFFA